jgi:membrane fusion protein (multidrug efflux system)
LRGKIRPGMSVTAKVNIKDAPEDLTTKVSSKDTLDDGR